MEPETIKQAWLAVFPESHAWSREILNGKCVALHLLKPEECTNGIQENDPLVYKMWIEGENVRESDLHILTRPAEGKNLVYDSAKMRRQTIKNADYDKLVKRFEKVRAWIKQQDMNHDISGKV